MEKDHPKGKKSINILTTPQFQTAPITSVTKHLHRPIGNVLRGIRLKTPSKGGWLRVQSSDPSGQAYFGKFEGFAILDNEEVRWIIRAMGKNGEVGDVWEVVFATECSEAGAEEVEKARKCLLAPLHQEH